jgi:capsular polysaccharide biosynthesis protein
MVTEAIMKDTISLFEFIHILKKRWKLIVASILSAALISSLISFYVLTPIYQASTLILVNQKNSENKLDLTQLGNSVELINTYSVIIKSSTILSKVIDELELSQTVEQLNQNITISSQENSQVFSMTVEDSKPERAVEIANSVSETFQKEIKGIMSVDNVSILAKAELKENPVPVKPNHLFTITLAVVVGLLLGTGIGLLIELMDKTLKDEQDVADYLGLPILGSIQKVSEKESKKAAATIKKVGGHSLES